MRVNSDYSPLSRQKTNVAFKASLTKTNDFYRYLSEMPSKEQKIFNETLSILELKLWKRPEKDVLTIDKMPAKEAKSIYKGMRSVAGFGAPRYGYGGDWVEYPAHSFPEYNNEDLQLHIGTKNEKLGFYMNTERGPNELAEWLEQTYEYLKNGFGKSSK